MDTHKFAVGQTVDFDRKLTRSLKSSGPFEVTRVLPAENVRSQTYRIKSKTEAFERSATEYEIVAVPSSAAGAAEVFGAAAGADPVR
jgi:hypothetical protein